MPEQAPTCPRCGNKMVLRTAKRGRYKGKQFYGCSNYPDCREIVDLNDVHGETPDEREEFRESGDAPLLSPVHVEIKTDQPFIQTKFFQNVAAPDEFVKLLADKRVSIDAEKLNAYTQWRLDFPFPQNPINKHTRQVLSVAEKILTRGQVTLSSPGLKNAVHSVLKDAVDIGMNAGEAIKGLSQFLRIPFFPSGFESEEEKMIYTSTLEHPDVAPWVVPQVSASSLTDQTIDQASKQRVDFALCHPKHGNYILEIDGQQHRQKEAADNRRDQMLEAAGYEVIRIPTHEVRSQKGENLKQLINVLDDFTNNHHKNFPTPAERLYAYFKLGSQLQLAFLEAIRVGLLSIGDHTPWKYSLILPEWAEPKEHVNTITAAAIKDFQTIVIDLYELLTGKKIDFPLRKVNSEEADIIIDFSSSHEKTDHNISKYLKVSDVYFPFRIAQSLPGTEPIRIQNPNKKIVRRFLKYIFRKEDFLDGQWEGIKRTLQGEDSILLLPTGGGKSIAFQLASLLLPGVCLVIDPLIALIRDQITNLKRYGVDRAAGITSRLGRDNKKRILESFGNSQYLFCYVAPERLQMEDFRDALRAVTVNNPISVITIDEAHCVSEWGHDFRIAYLNIARNARNYCTKDGITPPLLGLTGTASRSVLRDIRRELEITDFQAVITPKSFDREELHFQVIHCRSDEKEHRLLGVLSSLPNKFSMSPNVYYSPRGENTNSGIIFYPHVNGQFGIYQGYKFLQKKLNTKIGLYGGKSPNGIGSIDWDKCKEEHADKFRNNEIVILACTKAFGMGIDKPNIRFTVHTNLPSSIESFYQEAGRAGRDREHSECVLIISNDYPERNRKLLDPSTSLDEIASIVDDIGFNHADDISRAMWFHVNAFKGIKKEIRQVKTLIDEIGDLQVEKQISVVFDRDKKTVREKAVHRLAILEVISDYTVNYATNEFNLILSGKTSEENLAAYRTYLANYDQNLADQAEKRASRKLHLSHREFVLYLAERLIEDFIYNIIELSRRRSLSEMLQASQGSSNAERFRARMLNYLELGEFSEILEDARSDPAQLDGLLSRLMPEIGSPQKAEELRGQVSRLLEGYPNNPALLLIRALAEVLCGDLNREIVFENFLAFLNFSLSPDGWGISPSIINKVTCQFINQVGKTSPNFAHDILIAYLEEIEEDRHVYRLSLKHLEMENSLYIVNRIFGELSQQVEALLQ